MAFPLVGKELVESFFGMSPKQKTSHPVSVNKLRAKDEKFDKSRGTTFVSFAKIAQDTFIDSALSGFSDYPMITEEAEPSLAQEPPHHAHPQLFARDMNQRFCNFQ